MSDDEELTIYYADFTLREIWGCFNGYTFCFAQFSVLFIVLRVASFLSGIEMLSVTKLPPPSSILGTLLASCSNDQVNLVMFVSMRFESLIT